MYKTKPIEGMRVTWVKPEEYPENPELVRHLANHYGTEGLTISSEASRDGKVTLSRGGIILRDETNYRVPARFKLDCLGLVK